MVLGDDRDNAAALFEVYLRNGLLRGRLLRCWLGFHLRAPASADKLLLMNMKVSIKVRTVSMPHRYRRRTGPDQVSPEDGSQIEPAMYKVAAGTANYLCMHSG
jgi:hypothetical protein